MHLAAYTLNLLLDTDRAAVGIAAIGPCEIDVLPAEPEDFAPAQPIENEEDERGVEWIRLGDGKELSCLIRSPWPDGPGVPLGQFD
jgi:hypothetical protein